MKAKAGDTNKMNVTKADVNASANVSTSANVNANVNSIANADLSEKSLGDSSTTTHTKSKLNEINKGDKDIVP